MSTMTNTTNTTAAPAGAAAPPAPKRPSIRRLLTHDIVLGLIAVLVVGGIAGNLSDYHVYVLTIVVIFAVVGASHVVLFGAAGQPSVGHAALLGAGVYTSIQIAQHTSVGIPLELVGGMAAGGLLGALIGLPSLRIGSLYLAIATLALTVVAQQIFFQWDAVTGGGGGISVPPVTIGTTEFNALGLLYIALAFLAVVLLLARNLLRGRTGRAWNALRTSPTAASSVGIALGWQKVAAFAVAGVMVGGSGVIYAHAVNYVAPEDFTVDLSILMLVVAVIGGQRFIWGAVLGAIFIQGLPELLRFVGGWRDTIYGAVFILVMLFFPAGMAGGVKLLWDKVRGRGKVDLDALADADRFGESAAAVATADAADGLAALIAADTGAHAATHDGARLTITDLKIVFGGVEAIGGVSLDIEPGSVVGLVGPNGAGKTTLLNAISAFNRPVEGSLAISGEQVLGTGAHKRTELGVARTFQNLSLHEGLTVMDHLLIGQHSQAGYGFISQTFRLPRFLRGEAQMRRQANRVLKLLELQDYAEVEVEDLPYGIQKRVDVARAVVSSPRLLLLDEPAAGLTHDEGGDLVERVLALAARTGTTVVLVEHNIDLVMRVADRVVALNFGKVIADDIPQKVREHHEFERSYLGA